MDLTHSKNNPTRWYYAKQSIEEDWNVKTINANQVKVKT